MKYTSSSSRAHDYSSGDPSFLPSQRLIRLTSLSITLLASLLFLALRENAAGQGTDPFDPSRVLRIEVQLDPDEWYELRTTHREVGEEFDRITNNPYLYYRANVTIDGKTFSNVGIRKKGFFGSVISTRPSLKLRFDKFDKGQAFWGQDMLTLNNNVQDFSQAHQLLAYHFFNRAGVHAPRANLAHVRVNGEDLGIYSNVESIRKPFIKKHFPNSKGYLFEGYAGDFTDEDFGRIVLKSGKKSKATKKLRQLKEAIHQSKSIQLSTLDSILNLEAFIRFWAAEVLLGHWDGYSGNRNNYYLYFDTKEDQFYFIPWGADSVFADPGPFIHQPAPKSVKAMSILCKRLWENESVRKRYRNEMRRLLGHVWNESEMAAKLEQIQSKMMPFLTVSSDQVRESTALITSFIDQRRTEVNAELNQAPTDWPDIKQMGPRKDEIVPMRLEGSFRTVFTKTPPAIPLETGQAQIRVTIGDEEQEPFSEFGSNALIKNHNFMVPRPDYPIVTLVAHNESLEKTWRLSFLLDPLRLKDKPTILPVNHFAVWAQLLEGDPLSPLSKRIPFGISGTLRLSPTSLEEGSEISGSFDLWTAAF